MASDWKLVTNVILGSVLLVGLVIFGLSKMTSSGNVGFSDREILLEGAKLVKENGEIKVDVVVFSDMQCPACKMADELIEGLESMNGVRYVFRHYPLPSIHKYAQISARAVEAAREMNKGFGMLDLLFDTRDEWSSEPKIEDKLVEYAKLLELDEKMFREKLSSSEVSNVVLADSNLGDSLRLSGTPTIIVNGEQISADFVMAKVSQLLKE